MGEMTAAVWAAMPIALAAPGGWATAAIVRIYAGSPARRWTLLAMAGLALLAVWSALVTPIGAVRIASLGLAWALLTLAAVDAATFRLPDPLTLPLAAVGLVLSLWLPGAPFWDHLAGAAAGYGFLAVSGWAFERLRGREGIGLGDAKLLAAAGAWLGWRPLPSVLIIACVGAFVWIGVRAIRRGRAVMAERLPFGAPLCLAIWLVWLYGPLAT